MRSSRRRRPAIRTAAALLAVLVVQPVGGGHASEEWRTWTGEPAWISNTGVYREGEFIYQDYLYDDHGANTDGINRRDLPFGLSPDPGRPTDQRWSPTGGSVRHSGDFMYAASNNHMANVADLIEFRVAADTAAVSYHVRLGDMTAEDSTVVGICLNEDRRAHTGLTAWPHGAALTDRLGCEHLITAWGTGATVTRADGTTEPLADLGGAVRADVVQATIDVRVPRSVADPATSTWRITVASGLWDRAGQRWYQMPPGPQSIGAPVPTGGGYGVPNIWDLLSNNGESNSYWLEERQSNDLARQTIANHYVDVDFARLAQPGDDPDPQITGFLARIYRSQHPMTPARGIEIVRSTGTNFVYKGPYQPYAMVVPSDYYDDPTAPYPFDQCLHPLNGNHMVEVYYSEAFARDGYNPLVTGTTDNTGRLGFGAIEDQVDRLGTLYACVLGRGEGVGYTGGDGMVDALEVAADVERHYRVDGGRRTLHGVSLGAIGSWYMTQLYPDRFAATMPTIFSPTIVNSAFPLLGNLHNVPVFFAIGTLDQFAQGTQGDPTADAMEREGNEYVYVHYLGRQHEGRIQNDSMPFQEALSYSRERVADPARVRYTFEPARFSSKIPGDGSAYWVRSMTPRAEGRASIDATSLARADQLPAATVIFDGLYTNTVEGWQARIRGLLRMSAEEFRAFWQPDRWEPGWRELSLEVTEVPIPPATTGNAFTMRAGNLGAVRLDTERMNLDTSQRITATIEGDGSTALTLSGPFGGTPTATLDGEAVPVITNDDASITIVLDLTPGGHELLIG